MKAVLATCLFSASLVALPQASASDLNESEIEFAQQLESVYLRGTFNAWKTTPMKLIGDNKWQAQIQFGPRPNERFKFDIFADWSLNYGDANNDGRAEAGGGDILVAADERYTITFNDKRLTYSIKPVKPSDALSYQVD